MLLVFSLTAVFIVYYFQVIDPTKAFLLGFAVPSGAHLAGGGFKAGGEKIDDLESEPKLADYSLGKRFALWFSSFGE